MNINSVFSWVQGIVKLRGNSSNTLIGNVGDRLKVDSLSAGTNYLESNQMYSITASLNMAVANSNNPLIYFKNPTGSGKRILVTAIQANISVVNVGATFQVFDTNTVTTDGTAITPRVRNINNSQPASIANVFSLPTGVTLSTLSLHRIFIGQNSAGSNILENNFFILQPNSNFILTGDPSSNNRQAEITVVWGEL